MLIKSVEIENFRNFKKFQVELNEFNLIIGENNIGKTNFFKALDMILNPWVNIRSLEINEDDFQEINNPIKIKITINEIDEEIKKDLRFDMYDPEDETLIIEFNAFWNEENNEFKPKIIFSKEEPDEDDNEIIFRKEYRKLVPFFPIYIDKSAERTLNLNKRGDFGNLVNHFIPELTNPLKILELRCITLVDELRDLTKEYTQLEALFENCNHIREKILDFDYSKLLDEIDKIFTLYYDLAQDLEIPSERDTAINQVLEKIKKSLCFFFIKKKNQQILASLSENIKKLTDFQDFSSECMKILQRLVKFSTFDMDLHTIDEKKIFSNPTITIDSFSVLLHGTGYQNKIIIALKLLNIISYLKNNGLKSAFIGIEEPELNLHPHHQRDLISKIKEFVQKIKEEEGLNLQIIFTSHSSEILRRIEFSDLILLKKEEGTVASRIPSDFINTMTKELAGGSGSNSRIKKNLIKYMQNLFRFYPETFFSRVVILGEGPTEEGALPEFGKTLGNDFDEFGITFVCTQSESTMHYYRKILDTIKIPYFYILDKDRGDRLQSDPKLIITNEKAFEDEIFSTIAFSKILEVLIQLIPEQTSTQWINTIKSQLPDEIKNLDELIAFSKNNDLDNTVTNFFKKLLPKYKGILLGHLIGDITARDEIPDSYRILIEKASKKSQEGF
ncbi:MAG: hypothetical protein RBG13Loki_3426 [Promethearchaeota archaeon CR_4]|nr:MAG: hypothetical protein RBG13Loki_3426 [Candidatus Lokiarchaeota archaeon CR_4]